MIRGLYLALFTLILSACSGYHIGESPSQQLKVSVPFIAGDKDGIFTEQIIKEIVYRTPWQYRTTGEDARLCVRILSLEDENIGFRYDRSRSGKRKNYIVPIETRLMIYAEVTLIRCDGSCMWGPYPVEASIDFDHNYYLTQNAVNLTSLGQLNDIDSARDIAILPLSRALAREIADLINLCSDSL